MEIIRTGLGDTGQGKGKQEDLIRGRKRLRTGQGKEKMITGRGEGSMRTGLGYAGQREGKHDDWTRRGIN
jgi:hypothetical protein